MLLNPEEIIKAICPELSGGPSLQVYLGMAAESIDRGFFGSMYNHAVAYKAAHLFTLMDGGSSDIAKLGGGAPITSMSEGALSVSFAQSAGGFTGAGSSDLESTKYGRMLCGIMKGRARLGVNQA
ncbi:MAG: DUF4054 domain-containing protein [Treponema sp.]|jgi:hypothetical protein|nr:DUF4054 domain-containing protein [Treponema sp.]